jgi:ATP-dependent DNA helicase RecG
MFPAAHESQHVEWKESWRDEYLKWLCGFANAQGGTLTLGKNDRGECIMKRYKPSGYLCS